MTRILRIAATIGAGLLLSGSFQRAAAADMPGFPDVVLRELAARDRLPRGTYTLVAEWEAESDTVGHMTGQSVADADASGGRAWEGRVPAGSGLPPSHAEDTHAARPTRAGCLLYGPYTPTDPGDYVALFRIKLDASDYEYDVVTIDACVREGKEIVGIHEVTTAELLPGKYVRVPLAFHCPGGKLECRVQWPGRVGIRIDGVALYRLEGARLPADFGMVPQPEPTGEPNDLHADTSPTPYDKLFPRSAAPATRLTVADLRELPSDWQNCLLTLQGLVNRTRPRLYCLTQKHDEHWLRWMEERKWIEGTDPAPAPTRLIRRYAEDVRGVVIPDPAVPGTRNVATMIAGIENGLVASPRISAELSRLPVIADLRGRWKTDAAAYAWAFDELWPRLNHALAACLWPESLPLRDYLVQHRIPVFWLPGRIDGARPYSRPREEVAVVERLLARMPPNVPLLGYPWNGRNIGMGEGPGVTLFAEFAKYLVGSVGCGNLSVHSGIHPEAFRQNAPPPPPLDASKVHVAIIVSDGDNLPVLTEHNFPKLWADPLRGSFPIGWTLSPAAPLLIPDVCDRYYRTATTNDCFLGAVSGIGYTYPDAYAKRFIKTDRARIFDGFLAQTAAGQSALDMNTIWIMNAARPEWVRRYANRIPDLIGIFPDYGCRVSSYAEATYATARNVAVFHAASSWTEDAPRNTQIDGVVARIRNLTPKQRPAFLHLFIWNWGFDLGMIRDIIQRLGPEYVAQRPDHLALLYREWLANEKILVRTPSVVTAIEDTPLVFDAGVHNGTDAPLPLTVAAASGLRDATVQPAQLALAGAADAVVNVSGVPVSNCVELTVRSSFGLRRQAIECRLVPRDELLTKLPRTDAALRSIAIFRAENLSHQSGRRQPDTDAFAGAVWTVSKDRDVAGHIVYGPYTPLAAGHYVALFRLKRTGVGTGPLVTVDTCVGGGSPTTGSETVMCDAVPNNAFRVVAIPFEHPGGTLETRVFWPGNASVAIDAVMIWGIGGDGKAVRGLYD